MVVSVNLDSFWVGFVSAYLALVVIGIVIGLVRKKK
jgi:hypothetical protein